MNRRQIMKNTVQKEHKVLHKVKKNWVVLSMSTFALLGGAATLPAISNTIIPNTASIAKADAITNGTFGTVSYTYDTATDTLTFTSGGTLPTASTSRLSEQFKHLKHIVFTQKVTAPANSQNLFAQIVYLQDITGIEKLDTSNVINMNAMFNSDYALTGLDLSSWNTDNVTDMSWMFTGNKSLRSLNVSSFNTKNVTNMMVMFNGIAVSSLNLSNFDTEQVTDMSDMFSWTPNLTSLDLSGWHTENVQKMDYMFRYATALKSLNISDFSTQSVNSMKLMFDHVGDGQLISVKLPSAHFDQAAGLGDRYANILAAGTGSVTNPNGATLTPSEYQTLFNTGNKTADWYVWGSLQTTTQNKTVTRTINYVDRDGKAITNATPTTQTLHYHRSKTTLPGTAYVKYGQWEADSTNDQHFDSVTVPQSLSNGLYLHPTIDGKAVRNIEQSTPTLNDDSDQSETINLSYANAVTSTTEHKVVRRTIRYQDTDGKEIASPNEQTLHFHRTATTDLVTGQINYSEWQADEPYDKRFASLAIPQTIAGKYTNPTLNASAVQSVDEETPVLNNDSEQDETLHIIYSDKIQTSTEHRTISRTVHYKNTAGEAIQADTVQTVRYHRTVTENLVTGQKSYSNWESDDDIQAFASITVAQIIDNRYDTPTLNGRSIKTIDAESLNINDSAVAQNETLTIIYQDKVTPNKPVNPVKPDDTPVSPVKPDNKPVDPVKPDNTPVTPVKPDNKPVNPVKPDDIPVSPVKPDNKPVDPVKPDDTPVSPVKPDDKPVVPVKPDDTPVSPVKPDDKPVAPVKPDATPITPTNQDGTVVTPVKPDSTPAEKVHSGNVATPSVVPTDSSNEEKSASTAQTGTTGTNLSTNPSSVAANNTNESNSTETLPTTRDSENNQPSVKDPKNPKKKLTESPAAKKENQESQKIILSLALLALLAIAALVLTLSKMMSNRKK